MKVSTAILQTIRDLGSEVFFSMPGRGIYPLLNELPGINGLRHITGLHESVLTNAADGYARSTGKPAVVNLYMGSGLMNGLNGLFMAYRDHVPMVVTSTQTESYAVGTNARAECDDILGLVRPVTKWAWEPTSPSRVQEALIRAWTIASTPPRGPTFLTLPVDFFDEAVEYRPVPETAYAPSTVADVSRVSEWLASAKAPAIVVGSEAVQLGAEDEVQELAQAIGAVLFSELGSGRPRGWKTPLFAGEIQYYKEMFSDFDVIFYVNVNTLERPQVRMLTSGQSKRHLMIASAEARLNEHVPADWVTFADPKETIRAILKAVSARGVDRRDARVAAISEHIGGLRKGTAKKLADAWDATPMSAARFFSELRKHVPQDAIIVEQCTTSSRAFTHTFDVPSPRNLIAASASNQGWGVAASIGVKAANPDRTVIGVVGDGGFMFCAQALSTAVNHDLPVIIVVMNNGGWRSMRRSVDLSAPKVIEAGMDLKFGWKVDFEAYAKALGARAATVERPDQIEAVIADALKSKEPFLINTVIGTELGDIDDKPRV